MWITYANGLRDQCEYNKNTVLAGFFIYCYIKGQAQVLVLAHATRTLFRTHTRTLNEREREKEIPT